MYTTEEEPANKLYLCRFLNTAARLSLVDHPLFLLFGRFIAQELVHKGTLIYDSVHSEFHLRFDHPFYVISELKGVIDWK